MTGRYLFTRIQSSTTKADFIKNCAWYDSGQFGGSSVTTAFVDLRSPIVFLTNNLTVNSKQLTRKKFFRNMLTISILSKHKGEILPNHIL